MSERKWLPEPKPCFRKRCKRTATHSSTQIDLSTGSDVELPTCEYHYWHIGR